MRTGSCARQEPNDARFQRVFSGAYWQIAGADGRVLLQSRSLWDESLPTPAAGPATRNLPGPLQQSCCARVQQVRLPRASEPFVAVVATDRSALDADVAAFRKRTAIALGLLVAAWLAVLASQVRFGLRPLHRLAQLEQVRRGDAQRIDTQGLGAEVAPLGEELNALLDHQQRMVACAHQCTGSGACAENTTERIGHRGRRRRYALARHRARAERTHAGQHRPLPGRRLAADHRQRTDVAAVAQALCQLMARVHGERSIAFTAEGIDPALQFAGASADLEEMLGNLLDNAGRWAQQQVTVEAETSEGQLRIEVRDDGPGLAADALEQVTQRGVRLDEREGSSGLGLAIVGTSPPVMAGAWRWRMHSRDCVQPCGCRWRDAANPTVVPAAGRQPRDHRERPAEAGQRPALPSGNPTGRRARPVGVDIGQPHDG